MRILLIVSLVVLSGCSTVESTVVKWDSRFNTLKDKTLVVLIEEHRAFHEHIDDYINRAKKEQIKSTERLERAMNGFRHD